ncbi:uncharacterized protein N7496_011737 [Penicillium cataractarum]|uniref:N-acetyltransferase domain-containing protein n=1 Tax=Penicillium cataractarum TaxID=2100454 RepID=A0A9W9RHE8_9EURO|nr:uncharacterized protein N7496_011737 [Penicillium cataractarum]KAJ5359324.1 hypothetical protein N7496_011737 [Penicillium cataractarum]
MYLYHGYDPGGYAYQVPPRWTPNLTGPSVNPPFVIPRVPYVESGMGELSLEGDTMELDPGPQAIRSPPPSAGPYVRPAVLEDAEEIVQIINWHMTAINSFDPDLELLEAENVGYFIETSHFRRLPFLVIVQQPDTSQISSVPPRPQIGGVAYIDAFDEIVTQDSIGDLRVYIHPQMMHRGYGTLLVDAILTLCDEHHRRRCNVEWRPIGEVQQETLRLTQLMCVISYPAQLEDRYAFTWHWLKNRFGFEDFGESRQDRAKNGYEYVMIYDFFHCLCRIELKY